MAAFTTQIRRFEDQWEFELPLSLRGPKAPLPAIPLAKSLQALHTQILSLIMDTSIKERETSCRGAVAALQRAGREADIDTSTLGFIASLPRFSAMRSLTNRNRVSERLGALAAWKWMDLRDETTRAGSPFQSTAEIDDLLATIGCLVFEAMVSLTGELTTITDDHHQASAVAHRRRLSQIAHEGKRQRHAPMRQLLVGYALKLRQARLAANEHLRRSDAVRAALLHFAELKGLPKERTLHGWLAASGWARDAARV